MAGSEQKWACFLILAYVAIARTQALPFREYGEVKAVNGTFKFVNDSLELDCNITNASIRENSSMLHFERSTKNDKSIIPSEYIEILSTRSIRLRLSPLDIDDDGIYTCFQETFSGETRVIGSQRIEIDYKPQKVKDITCRVYNWESMTCTWDLGVNFQHPEYIIVSLAWTIQLPLNSRSSSDQMDCPELRQKTSCHWDAENYTNGHVYIMRVEVSTKLNGKELVKERSQIFNVETQLYEESGIEELENHNYTELEALENHNCTELEELQNDNYMELEKHNCSVTVRARVEPAPVDNLQATVKNSSCVELQWQHSAIYRDKFFIAESKAANEDRWTPIILNEVLNKTFHSLVCSLTPYTNYSFRMSVMPYPVETSQLVRQGHRSEWRMTTAQTFEDVPGAAPNICLGCFVEIECTEKNTSRCVRLYWQDLKNHKKNGILKNYNITYSSSSETKYSTVPVEKSKRLSVDLNLTTADQSFKINISPGTSMGFSRSSSFLFLPAVQRKPNPPPNFLVEVDRTRLGMDIVFYLSWAALNTDAKTGLKYNNVTIAWCLHTKIPECENDIHWTEVPADHVTYELKLAAERHQHSDFLIGIAAEVISDSQIVSSGIHWSTCTFHRNEQPRNAPKNVRESAKHPVNGLTILWDKFECAEEYSFITEYLVKYCPVYEDTKCKEPEKTMNVSNSASEVTLENLPGNTKYNVSVMAISSAGLGPSRSLLSKTVQGFPLHDDESKTVIIAVILSFIIFAAVVAFLVWCCLKRKKKIPSAKNFLCNPMDNSIKKNHGVQNRPLPKTPEEPQIYGSSACMNNRGSDKAKDNSSGSYSEESVTSQSNLLTSNMQTNHIASSAVPEKSHEKKYGINTATTQEKKLLLNGTSSTGANSSFVGSKNASSVSDYCTLGGNDNCTSSQNNRIQSSNLNSASAEPSSSNTIHSSSGGVAEYHQLASIGSEFSHTADLLDPEILCFSNTRTLPLRGQHMEMSVCPVRLPLINPLCSSVLGDRGLSESAPLESKHFQSNKAPFPYFASTEAAPLKLPHSNSLPHASLPESGNSGYVAHSQIEQQVNNVSENNQSLGYSRVAEDPHNQRHDESMDSFLNFIPSSASSPPSPCPVDTCLPTYPVLLSYSSHTQFQLPLYDTYVPDSAAMTPQHSSNNNNGYTSLEAFSKIPPVEDRSACSTCLTNGPSHNPTSNPSYVWNHSLANNPDIYVDNMPHVDNRNDNERPLVIGDYIYNPNTTATTLPRNISSGSATLLLPSPISRPLSGDLLQLPLKYYEDPSLDGSNPTLTEL